jgi:hypothetical protein
VLKRLFRSRNPHRSTSKTRLHALDVAAPCPFVCRTVFMVVHDV